MKIGKVLLVDDDVQIRKIAEISLRRVGKWDVCVAASGKEALAVAESEKPDIILLDVTMPDMDGPTTFMNLKACQATAEIPVIFLTGHVLEEELAAFDKLGVSGVISKPFDPLKLPEEINRVLKSDQ